MDRAEGVVAECREVGRLHIVRRRDDHPYVKGCMAGPSHASMRPGGTELSLHALRCAGFTVGQRVLDLGCGEGVSLKLLRRHGCVAVGVDPAAQAGSDIVAAGAQALPFADASFDGILAECSLSLAGYSAETLGECARVLKPGGRFAITDMYARAGHKSSARLPGCLAGITRREDILAELAQAGFSVNRWEDHSPVLNTILAQLIFEHGSADALWADDDPHAALDMTAALHKRKPGYFLLIATKANGRE